MTVTDITGVYYYAPDYKLYKTIEEVIAGLHALKPYKDEILNYPELVYLSEVGYQLASRETSSRIFQTQSQEIRASYSIYQRHSRASASKKRKNDKTEDFDNFLNCKKQLLRDLGVY
jgi:hypothetical protein